MDESGFRHWLVLKGSNPKIISDTICRVKKLNKDFDIDFDGEYQLDGGRRLMELFNNKGYKLSLMKKESTVPVGQYPLATYKLAAKKYIDFAKETARSRS